MTKNTTKTLDATSVQAWLDSKDVPNAYKEQIKKMTKKEQKFAFSTKPLHFGTAGVRAKMGPGTQYMNIYTCQQMAIGYCKYILNKKFNRPAIFIAHDNRLNSDKFAMECAKIANGMGIAVYMPENNKLLPTPILSYAIRKYRLAGGINITASHNPAQDNGFKAYNHHGAQILPDEANVVIKNMPHSKEILDLSAYLKPNAKENIEYVKYDQLTESFFNDIIKATVIDKPFLTPKAPIKTFPIVFTGFHGTTTELMPRLLDKIGFTKIFVYPKHAKISGLFEDCPISNPENDKAFTDVIRYANSVKSTMIIGCDPDGDRMAIGFKKTNRWRFLRGNEMGIIFTHYILNRRRFKKVPLIYSTHVSTSYIDLIAAKHGAEVIRTNTGFKWMSNMIDKQDKKYEFILGFEEAIGSLVHDVCRDKDAFGATLLALEVLNRGNAYFPDLHDYLCDRIYDCYGPTFSQTFSYVIKADNWEAAAKKMMYRALHVKNKKLFDYQIVKTFYDKESDCVVWTLDKDSWIKFRLSGTEPKFKVYLNLNNEMAGQLKAAALTNITKIEDTILKGFEYIK